MSFIAGAYTISWDTDSSFANGTSLGQTRDGIEVEEPGITGEPITGDNYGPNLWQDGVLLPGNFFISCTCLEYDAVGIRKLLSQPYWDGSTLQTTVVSGVPGLPGQLWSSLAKKMVLTRVSGTIASPTTRKIYRALLAPNFPIKYLMSPRHRTVPIRFLCLPETVNNVNRVWVDA